MMYTVIQLGIIVTAKIWRNSMKRGRFLGKTKRGRFLGKTKLDGKGRFLIKTSPETKLPCFL